MKINPLTAIDFYKADHRRQYPEGTEFVYSNFTPRSSIDPADTFIIWFGLQYFLKSFLIETWNENFFNQDKKAVVAEYKKRMDYSLGKDAIETTHIEELHDLGYLPVHIKSLPEGSKVNLGIPVLTIINTDPRFFWITNYLETVMSAYLWKMTTSATTAYKFKQLGLLPHQAHDFSFRGMSGVEDAAMSGAGHLTSFTGTDNVPAIDLVEKYYYADVTKETVGQSVPATEHSVMCMGGKEDELGTFKRLITEVYPIGTVSIVSDTWDFWRVMTEYLPQLNDIIRHRDGMVVIRPDSGDPIKIICGDPDAATEHERLGAMKLIEDLDNPNLGLIYGDSITYSRAKEIISKLESIEKLVLGVGSYTYQYVTRDTFGFAMKATWGQVKGQPREIFKEPKTGDGKKKSARGLLKVEKRDGHYILIDSVSAKEEQQGYLTTVFKDGIIYSETTLQKIRQEIEYD